ncbi:MAG: alpha/beta hydrolase [Burkholderiaceae bacterium]|nr:alpha/beta hydrolase [Burkholderiaceae bacterium]
MSNVDFSIDAIQDDFIDPSFEAEYNLRIRHPERTEVYRDYAERSVITRARNYAKLDVPYGKNETSLLDLFIPESNEPSPLLIFIHGGYWRALDKSIFSFIADEYVSRGIAVAIPNYNLAPKATVSEIVTEVAESVSWLSRNGDFWNYDDNKIIISGHSAGGHMAAKMICRNVMPELQDKVIGYVGLSSLFDLEPLLLTSINLDLNMSKNEAKNLGFHSDEFFEVPMVLAAGGNETSGFLNQSLDFFLALKKYGHNIENITVPQRNHFDLLADFSAMFDPSNHLFNKVLELFKLQSK